jgi:hypothetical protein
MATWSEFENDAPDLAEAGKKLLYQFGVGLGFLARCERTARRVSIRFAQRSWTAVCMLLLGRRRSAPI